MGFSSFLTEVEFDDGTTQYRIPVWNLKIKAQPWHSSGQTQVELFWGRMAHRYQGYIISAEFDMNFGHDGVDDQLWSDLLNDISNGVEWTIDFDPDTNPGVRTASFILDDSSSPLQALFMGRIRNRATSTRWVSPDILSTLPDWIAEGTSDDPAPPSGTPVVQDLFYITDPSTGTNGDIRKLTV